MELGDAHGCSPPLCRANSAAAHPPTHLLPAPPPPARFTLPLQLSMALAARRAKQLPKQPGLAFCYDMLNRVSRRCTRMMGAAWRWSPLTHLPAAPVIAYAPIVPACLAPTLSTVQPPPRTHSRAPPAPAPCRRRRSFAVVIQQLPESLRDAVCVFYLVLRALDTVEDDMRLDPKVKIPLLRCFHEKSYDRCGGLGGGSRGVALLGAVAASSRAVCLTLPGW